MLSLLYAIIGLVIIAFMMIAFLIEGFFIRTGKTLQDLVDKIKDKWDPSS